MQDINKTEEKMQKRTLGKTDINISAIIMGTWQAGKDMWVGIDDADTLKALRAAYDAGITTFDTAEVYGNGHSERIIAQALSDVRDKIVLATKVFPTHLQHDQVVSSCENSLKNLKTDYIDLYFIHWPPGSFGMKKVPLEETMGALVKLKEQGKIRAIGVSNFNKQLIQEAEQYGAIDCLQPPYSLIWRAIEKETAPYCRTNNITITAYSPMAQGLLTGKFGPDHTFEKGDNRAGNRLFRPENLKRVHEVLEKIRPIAEKYGISLGQLALAWVMHQPGTCAIAGARNEQQAVQNAAAGEIVLSAEDIAEMDKVSHIVTDHLDDNPVMWG